ncbi:hypothetical protein REPUB_Repub06bG0179900 [Reevesia pubescens]
MLVILPDGLTRPANELSAAFSPTSSNLNVAHIFPNIKMDGLTRPANELSAAFSLVANKSHFGTFSLLQFRNFDARDLEEDQELKLSIPIDGRNRLRPPLPPGYFGNVIFLAAQVAVAGDLVSEPLIDTVKRIHEIIKEMDDDYLRAGIDYIEKADDITSVKRTPKTMQCPNLLINSWMWLPIHDADFGWGRPVFMRPANIVHEGKAYILPSPTKDGSLTLVTRLETAHMKAFGSFLYQI